MAEPRHDPADPKEPPTTDRLTQDRRMQGPREDPGGVLPDVDAPYPTERHVEPEPRAVSTARYVVPALVAVVLVLLLLWVL